MTIAIMNTPAQKILIDRMLDWNKIEKNLSEYLHITKRYPIADLKKLSEKSPFYCHIVSWFLNYNTKSFLNNFDSLLANAEAISSTPSKWEKKWKEEGKNRDGFDSFYSLLWELQVAKFFTDRGAQVEWLTGHKPDIKATIGKEEFFVECYNYYKSFAVKLYIEEVLLKINPEIRVEYTYRIKFALPQNNKTENFLNEIFSLFLDDNFLKSKTEEAKKTSPVELYRSCNFRIELYGEAEYQGRENAHGDSDEYCAVALKEVIGAKKDSNNLPACHPNILAVNFLLSRDMQSALSQHQLLGNSISVPNNIAPLDSILIAACGIDSNLNTTEFIYFSRDNNHPAKALFV